LLLLRRERSRLFTGDEVARELRVHPASASRWLEDLTGRRFALRDGERFQFSPEGATTERDLNALSSAYADARVAVIQLIFSKPSDSLRSFSDAFKFKGRP
jgi:DNA-binding IclR family transcriptional regulator